MASFSSDDDITVQKLCGSLATMTSSDNITWTGTDRFTPSSDVEDATNVLTLATSYTDTAGNAPGAHRLQLIMKSIPKQQLLNHLQSVIL